MDDNKRRFDKYYRRLKQESIVKAVLSGLLIGFAVNFVIALVTWLLNVSFGLLLSIVVGAAVGVLGGIILYFIVFKLTTKNIADRMDSYGLEERILTMVEFENDDSNIAAIQREDAKRHLGMIDSRSIKFEIAKPLRIAAIVVTILGFSMTTINALAKLGVVPSGDDVFVRPVPPIEYISVTYDMDGGGIIEGIQEQIVEKGKDAETVIAIADDGYSFMGWSDGLKSPERTDRNVTEEIIVTAQFTLIGDSYDDSDPMESDDPSQPQDPGEQDQEQEEQQDPSEGQDNQNRYLPSNQIIDRNTAYQDELANGYYQAMLDYLQEHPDEFTEEEKEFIQRYFEVLMVGVDDEEEDGE